MLQYLVILLDDTAVAYCHADNPLTERNLMPLDTLRKAIVYGMKENLMIQFVYPAYDLPDEYNTLIESIDHIKIGREVAVFNTIPEAISDDNVVLRLRLGEVLARPDDIARPHRFRFVRQQLQTHESLRSSATARAPEKLR